MAQTIAMQRGSTSATFDNTRYTLFTQSGGNATRVIINAITVWSGGGFGTPAAMMLQVLNSGTSVYLPIAMKSGGGAVSPSAMTFIPETVGVNAGAVRTSTTETLSGQTLWFPGGSGWPSASDANLVGAASNVSQSNGQFAFEYCPKNFWIGPGDSVILQVKGSSNPSGTMGWSFTTITET
jgi:hypothetical protein